jgi:hypothetical protein
VVQAAWPRSLAARQSPRLSPPIPLPLKFLTSQGLHCPSHPPGTQDSAPRLQVHITTFSLRDARGSPNACRWTTFDVNIMDVIQFVFFLVIFVECVAQVQSSNHRDLRPPKSPTLSIPISLFFFHSPSLCAMAPGKAKQPIEPAAPAAVEQSKAKTSRRTNARPIGSSRTRSKATLLVPFSLFES